MLMIGSRSGALCIHNGYLDSNSDCIMNACVVSYKYEVKHMKIPIGIINV